MKERALVATYLDFVWCLLFWIQAEGVANDAYQIKSYWTLTFFVGGSTLEILEGRGEWEDLKIGDRDMICDVSNCFIF